jgi:hypothetical protein
MMDAEITITEHRSITFPREASVKLSRSGIVFDDGMLHLSGEPDEAVKLEVPKQDFEKFVRELRTIQIPAFPSNEMGLDGTTYEIQISNGFNDATYSWWEDPPEGWEPLKVFFDRLMAYAQRLADEQYRE